MTHKNQDELPSLRQIAQELGVSRQGVSLIEARALKKLRDSALKEFAIYLEDDPEPCNAGKFIDYNNPNRWA